MKTLQRLMIALLILISSQIIAQAPDAKMKLFVDALMKKMTQEEKIGQLNLVTPGGGVATGAVVSSDVETKIKGGHVGGLFDVIGVEKIKQAQQLAVNNSRLPIPLIFGSDVMSDDKRMASREFAEHSFVLLKNNN